MSINTLGSSFGLLENDLIYPKAPLRIRKKMEQRILTQQEYLAELFLQKYFSVDSIPADSIEPLTYYIDTFTELLKVRSKDLRKAQIDSLEAIVTHLKKGKFKGLIKLPTGTGKTRLFAEVIGAINVPSVVLIPRTSLKGQTMDGFIDHDVIDNDRVFLIGDKESKEKGAVAELRTAMDSIEKNHITNPIILITYQSLLSVKRSDPELFDRFRRLTQCIIRDEAHRSIGDETAEALEELKKLEEGFDESDKKLELLLTATPKLLAKDIRDNYETIISIRTQEVVEQGDLIMPRRRTVGKSYVNADTENVTEEFLKANSLKFVDQHGIPIYKKIIAAYKEEKEKQPNGYLPFVAFCSTIEQAEFIRIEMEKEGIRASRVTSGNQKYDKGVSEDDAKIMLIENETDGVSTVAKVAEGWDVKTLRCALHFCPIRSEAKYIQGTGRIMRTLPSDEVNHFVGMTEKNTDNTIIIEPDIWYVGSNFTEDAGDGDGNGGSNGGWNKKEEDELNILTQISGLGHLINSGEFDEGFLEKHYGSLDAYDDFKGLMEVDANGRVIIDGIEYQRVSQVNASPDWYKGITPWKVNDHVRSQTDEWKRKYVRKARSYNTPVMVVELNALRELLKQDMETPFLEDLETGRMVIGGKEYQRAGHNLDAKYLWGVQGFTAIAKIKKQNQTWHDTYVKTVRSRKGPLKVIALDALQDILKGDANLEELGDNGKTNIGGKEYQWVGSTTPPEQLQGLNGLTITNLINQQSDERKKQYVKKAKSKNGLPVMVVEARALEKLLTPISSLPRVNENGRVEVDGKEYQWVGEKTPPTQLRGMTGVKAKSRVMRQSGEWKNLYTKTARSNNKGEIMVVEVKELEKLIKDEAERTEVDEKGRIILEGIEYQRVGPTTPAHMLRGMSGHSARPRIDAQSDEWKKKYIKKALSNNKSVEVVNVEELRKLIKDEAELPVIEENGRVEVDGKEYQWVGKTTPAHMLWGMNGHVAKPRVEAQSPEWKKLYVGEARQNGMKVMIVEVSVLEKLIKQDAQMPELNSQGRTMIDGIEYQRVGVKTPAEQLRGISPLVVKGKIESQSDEWKKQYMKKAKSKTGSVDVIALLQLEEIMKEYRSLPIVGEDMRAIIRDEKTKVSIIYQWVGVNTPAEKLWGMPGAVAKNMIRRQSNEWKEKNLKVGIYHGKDADIIEVGALEALIKERAESPLVDDTGRIEIDGTVYQWVGHETPGEQLRGISGRSMQRKVEKQTDEWRQQNVKKAQKGRRPILIVNLEELRKIKDL